MFCRAALLIDGVLSYAPRLRSLKSESLFAVSDERSRRHRDRADGKRTAVNAISVISPADVIGPCFRQCAAQKRQSRISVVVGIDCAQSRRSAIAHDVRLQPL